jgi:hypothetical protein
MIKIMKLVIYHWCLLAIFLYGCLITSVDAKPALKTIHISKPLSEKASARFEKYISYAYHELGYKVIFKEILVARAREMVDAGRLDGMLIAEKEINIVYSGVVQVPVMLAKGSLMLYCNKKVVCQKSSLNDEDNLIGVLLGNSMSANFMREMKASTYAVKSHKNLGVMLAKNRLKYVLTISEEHLGNISNLDDNQFQKVEVHRTEGYHYIHKKHEKLLPELTQALQLAIEKFGPLVKDDQTIIE